MYPGLKRLLEVGPSQSLSSDKYNTLELILQKNSKTFGWLLAWLQAASSYTIGQDIPYIHRHDDLHEAGTLCTC